MTNNSISEEWSLHISDAGEPPSMLSTAVGVLFSLGVAVLFLVIRPAAIGRVSQHTAAVGNQTDVSAGNENTLKGAPSSYRRFLWRVLTAVLTWPLYDVVHRTCCYLHLTPYMLARHKLLPLGNSFLWDGLWTEWVNWVRLYIWCGSSQTALSAAVIDSSGCIGWQLPLAGVLDYQQYPEYAALAVDRAPTDAEVHQYHKTSLAALLITSVAVVQLHSVVALLRHIFASPRKSTEQNKQAVADDVAAAPMTATSSKEINEQSSPKKNKGVQSSGNGRSKADLSPSYTTMLDSMNAPGDDAWVDSPEALAEEEARRKDSNKEENSSTTSACGGSASQGKSLLSASHTTHLVWQCWPSLLSAGYATMYAYVGGLPLLMTLVFPWAALLSCVLCIFAPV